MIAEAKAERLRALSNRDGVIAALAMDQRKSLRQLMAGAAGVPADGITTAQLSEFKECVTRVLSPYASAVLLDPEYGQAAFGQRAAGCGLLVTYEMDGFENPRPHRMLALLPHFSARRLRQMGADGLKVLLSWTPFDDETANDEKRAMVERIGHECEAAGVPFLLEPVGYDPHGLDPKRPEFAAQRAEIVIRSMEEFSQDIYKVDLLKVEFPLNVAWVEGSPVFDGRRVFSRDEALDLFRRADAAARRPYIYLSAGVSGMNFTESLRMAAEAGAGFSGVLCGRSTWKDGVAVYVRGGAAALEEWLSRDGVANIRAVNECLTAAKPWFSRVP